MPNVFVYIGTLKEYDEYMEMCEEAGWKWLSNEPPTQANMFSREGDMYIEIISTLSYHKTTLTIYDQSSQIISLGELKHILSDKDKTCLEFKELHPYLIYVLLENAVTLEIIDDEIDCIFHTDDFLIRVVGETHDFEIQFGVRKTFDKWSNSVDFTFSLEINEEDSFETILIYIESRIRIIKDLYDAIPLDFFRDPCLKISV